MGIKDVFNTIGDTINKGVEDTIGFGNDILDGVVTNAGLVTVTVVEGLVQGGSELGITSTEVGSNILGALGEGFGNTLSGMAEALGIPTPQQVGGSFLNFALFGGLAILAILLFSRSRSPAYPTPQFAMSPSGQVVNVASY